eukprot:g33.t1
MVKWVPPWRSRLVLLNVASMYHLAGDHKSTRDTLQRARRGGEEAGDNRVVSIAVKRLRTLEAERAALASAAKIANEALHLQKRNQLDEALAKYRKALGTFVQHGSHSHVGHAYNNIAALLKKSGRLKEAMSAFESSLRSKQIALGKQHRAVGATLSHMGHIAIERGEWAKAVTLFDRAAAVFSAPQSDRAAEEAAHDDARRARAEAEKARIRLAEG